MNVYSGWAVTHPMFLNVPPAERAALVRHETFEANFRPDGFYDIEAKAWDVVRTYLIEQLNQALEDLRQGWDADSQRRLDIAEAGLRLCP